MGQINIQSQILEVRRELNDRQSRYRHAISRGTMREAEATLLIGRMQAVLETLRWCETNRPAVLEFLEARKAAEAAGTQEGAAA